MLATLLTAVNYTLAGPTLPAGSSTLPAWAEERGSRGSYMGCHHRLRRRRSRPERAWATSWRRRRRGQRTDLGRHGFRATPERVLGRATG